MNSAPIIPIANSRKVMHRAHELPVPDQRGRQHRVAAVALRERERDREQRGRREQRHDQRRAPAAVVRLHQPVGEAEDRRRRSSPSPTSRPWCRRAGRASPASPAARARSRDADRHVDQEDPVPARRPTASWRTRPARRRSAARARRRRWRPPPSARARGRAARAGTRASSSRARAAPGLPAPTACTTRNAISASIDDDSAHSSDPTVKIDMPIRKKRCAGRTGPRAAPSRRAAPRT